MRALALLCLVAGCGSGSNPVDECAGTLLANERCVTFHLSAETAIEDAQVTSVLLWVHYTTNAGERNTRVQTATHAPVPFPVAVGLHLPLGLSGFADVKIEALTGPGVVAFGSSLADPAPGEHQDRSVTLERPQVSGCFDGQQGAREADVDCGGDCPPCAFGARCITGEDCQSLVCTFDSTNDVRFCN